MLVGPSAVMSVMSPRRRRCLPPLLPRFPCSVHFLRRRIRSLPLSYPLCSAVLLDPPIRCRPFALRSRVLELPLPFLQKSAEGGREASHPSSLLPPPSPMRERQARSFHPLSGSVLK